MLVRFLEDEDGATAIEYGLIAGLVCIALIACFVIFGDALKALFAYVRDSAGNAMDNAQV
jgi:pilus assembly protein Flp/PilA